MPDPELHKGLAHGRVPLLAVKGLGGLPRVENNAGKALGGGKAFGKCDEPRAEVLPLQGGIHSHLAHLEGGAVLWDEQQHRGQLRASEDAEVIIIFFVAQVLVIKAQTQGVPQQPVPEGKGLVVILRAVGDDFS